MFSCYIITLPNRHLNTDTKGPLWHHYFRCIAPWHHGNDSGCLSAWSKTALKQVELRRTDVASVSAQHLCLCGVYGFQSTLCCLCSLLPAWDAHTHLGPLTFIDLPLLSATHLNSVVISLRNVYIYQPLCPSCSLLSEFQLYSLCYRVFLFRLVSLDCFNPAFCLD